ncbi:MAG TPA: hypothetical protein VGR93_07105 [Candidatus Acidoferrales bacterium]|nr:hypothetical protein [Candidatus Acidoferrales bacterium]
MKRNWRLLLSAALAAMLAVILARIVAPERRASANQDEDDEQEAIKAPARVSVQNGQTIVTLNASTQSRVGIAVAPLQGMASREQVAAPAVILSPQELVTARANYVTATANLERARTKIQVDQEEYARLNSLYQDQKNASQKDVQAAQGALRSDEADIQSAQQEVTLQVAAVRQSWGEAVANWVANDSAILNRALNQSDFLVEVTLPAGSGSTFPQTITLDVPGIGHSEARLISVFPRVDPRIQGIGLLYVTQNHLGFAPGLSLIARLPVGRAMRGVLIPNSAIVWWQGNAWVYVQTAPEHFVRQLVPTGEPLANGLFVSTSFSPGEQIVARGAQLLLSEEFRSQIQPED